LTKERANGSKQVRSVSASSFLSFQELRLFLVKKPRKTGAVGAAGWNGQREYGSVLRNWGGRGGGKQSKRREGWIKLGRGP